MKDGHLRPNMEVVVPVGVGTAVVACYAKVIERGPLPETWWLGVDHGEGALMPQIYGAGEIIGVAALNMLRHLTEGCPPQHLEAYVRAASLEERLRRIAAFHREDPQYEGFCEDCSQPFPCPTWHWASDEKIDLAVTWSPDA